MNARQKAKKLKKKINTLKSDNDLMRRIIAESPIMQELYDAYNKPKFVTHTMMHFQEYRSRWVLSPDDRPYNAAMLERAKWHLANDLTKQIKDHTIYKINTEDSTPTITASIFIGEEE